MHTAIANFNNFKAQAHSSPQPIKLEDIKNQKSYLEDLCLRQSVSPTERKTLEKYIRVYDVAINQINALKKSFTTPELFNQYIAQILDNEIQQFTHEKTSEIRSSQIDIPTFKKKASQTIPENVIEVPQEKTNIASPLFQSFFQKKYSEVNFNKSKSNFKSIIQENKDSLQSVSRQQSRSSSSSFVRRNGQEAQLKRVLEENKKIKEEYERRMKRELELSEFQKKLLKDEKDRYMKKIEELQGELENLYRANYKLKEEVEIKQKTMKDRSEFGNSDTFRNVDQDIVSPYGHGSQFGERYAIKTKHNDLKRLNDKWRNKQDFSQIRSNGQIITNLNHPPEDFLGFQLQKQLQAIEKQYSMSNHSKSSGKKQGAQQQNGFHMMKKGDDDLISVLKKVDSHEELKNGNAKNGNNHQKQNKNKVYDEPQYKASPFQRKPEQSFSREEESFKIMPEAVPPINILPPSKNRKPLNESAQSVTSLQHRRFQQSYQPESNYSFTKAQNKDYSMASNPANYDTFEMTNTYLNISQNQESQTNKYIDSRTSTRNKVAFFKDSLILIKNDTFQLAFKRSALVNTKDRVRVIFFIKNKTNRALAVSFRYEYDASYYKLKVNQKIETIPANSQARQDLEIYAYSTIDLNEVIDIMVDVDFNKFGLWMPVLWIQFEENDKFKLPNQNQEISFIPDRQFKSFDSAQSVMPLMWGGKNSQSQWAYLYGLSKFGACFVKLTWENHEIKIQTDAKWIDLLAFVMHHVK